MAALSVALGIVLSILAFLLLLLSLPVEVRVSLRLSEGTSRVSLSVGYSFRGHRLLTFNVLPPPNEPRRPSRTLRPDAGPRPGPEPERDLLSAAKEKYARFREAYPAVKESILRSVRAVTISEFRLKVWLGTGDAFETAMLSGGLRAALGIALSRARRWGLKFRSKARVAVWPVYERAHLSLTLDAVLSVRPITAISAAPAALRAIRGQVPRRVVGLRRGWNTKA